MAGEKQVDNRKNFYRLTTAINWGYRYIFHSEISADVDTFLRNLLHIGIGTAISTLFSTIFTILGGRTLGPDEYGKFVLIQSAAMFLYIPMLLGFNTAMLKYTSEKPDTDRQASIISTTLILVFMFTMVSMILYVIFKPQLSRLFSISPDLLSIALIFAFMYVFYTITTDILRGLGRMRVYAVFQVVYSSTFLAIFLFFLFRKLFLFKAMTYPMLFAYGISGMLILVLFLRKYLRWRFNRDWAKTLTKYALFAVIGGLSYVFYTSFGKIMISKYMNIADVGIYSAYYTASINVIGLFWGMFNIVFFPAVSKYKDKGIIFKRINILLPFLFGLGIPFVLFCEFIILKLFGSQYPINILLMVLFALTSICITVDGLYGWLFNSTGAGGAGLTSISAVLMAVIAVVLNFILIPRIGITGAVISLLIAYFVSTILLFYLGKKHLFNGGRSIHGINN